MEKGGKRGDRTVENEGEGLVWWWWWWVCVFLCVCVVFVEEPTGDVAHKRSQRNHEWTMRGCVESL